MEYEVVLKRYPVLTGNAQCQVKEANSILLYGHWFFCSIPVLRHNCCCLPWTQGKTLTFPASELERDRWGSPLCSVEKHIVVCFDSAKPNLTNCWLFKWFILSFSLLLSHSLLCLLFFFIFPPHCAGKKSRQKRFLNISYSLPSCLMFVLLHTASALLQV